MSSTLISTKGESSVIDCCDTCFEKSFKSKLSNVESEFSNKIELEVHVSTSSIFVIQSSSISHSTSSNLQLSSKVFRQRDINKFPICITCNFYTYRYSVSLIAFFKAFSTISVTFKFSISLYVRTFKVFNFFCFLWEIQIFPKDHLLQNLVA